MRKFILLICVLFLTACQQAPLESLDLNIEEIEFDYVTTEVTRGDITESIDTGMVMFSPQKTKKIVFFESVVVDKIYFSIGERIEAGELIAQLETVSVDEEIMYQEFEIEKARAKYNELKRSGASRDALKLQELDIEILKLDLNKLHEKKESFSIYAEEACYISRGSLIEDRVVRPYEDIFVLTMADTFTMKTFNEIDFDKYPNIQIGDSVDLILDDHIYKGLVSYMTVNFDNKGLLYFKPLEQIDFGNKTIYQVQVMAELNEQVNRDVLYVPLSTVRDNIKKYVEVYDDGIKRVRYVKLGNIGLSNDGELVVEIVRGLKEGETVIIKEELIGENNE